MFLDFFKQFTLKRSKVQKFPRIFKHRKIKKLKIGLRYGSLMRHGATEVFSISNYEKIWEPFGATKF